MKQFYSGTPYIPREIFLPGDIEERQVLEAWLSEKRGQKVTPKQFYNSILFQTTYRKGNINITPSNIGLGNVENKSSAGASSP